MSISGWTTSLAGIRWRAIPHFVNGRGKPHGGNTMGDPQYRTFLKFVIRNDDFVASCP